MDTLMSIIVSGIVMGSLYSLMAGGLVLVWTTLGMFNFAHGILMAFGAYVAWTFAIYLELGLWLGALLGIIASALLGIIIEHQLVRPFYRHKDMMMVTVMTSLAAMIIIEKSILMTWGARLKQLPRMIEGKTELFGVTISSHEFAIVLLAPVILITMWLFVTKTRIGLSLRAVGQNQVSASLIGVNTKFIFSLSFAISAALAATSGILLGGLAFVKPAMGDMPLIKAMIVVILGGMSSMGYSIGTAYLIGLMEAALMVFVGLYWTPFVLFLFMIIGLVIRPNGLFEGANK